MVFVVVKNDLSRFIANPSSLKILMAPVTKGMSSRYPRAGMSHCHKQIMHDVIISDLKAGPWSVCVNTLIAGPYLLGMLLIWN